MDFTFSDDQKQLRDAIRRYLSQEYSFEQRKKILQSESGVSPTVWSGLAELGLMSVPVPEAAGGFGGNGVDLMVVMEELGRALVVEPFFATAVMGVAFLKHGSGEAHHALLSKVVAGEAKLGVALGEAQSRYELFNVATMLKDGKLNCTKTVVLHGAEADQLIVSARVSGAQRDQAGLTVVMVDAKAPGISMRAYRTIDGMRAADITFKDVAATTVLGEAGEGFALIEHVADIGTVALCGEAIGVMAVANEQTLEYLRTRQQFGKVIGAFQALQHRATEMFMQLEQAKSLTYLASVKIDSPDRAERRRAVSAAKVRVGRAIKVVGQEAIQMHGGMGMTWEMPISHYFKRMTMIDQTLGDVDHHLALFAAL